MTASESTFLTSAARRGRPLARFSGLSLDALDVYATAFFWARALNGSVAAAEDGRLRVDSARGRPENELLWVVPTDEPRHVKTRVHLDLRLDSDRPEELLAAGAQVLREPGAEPGDPWFVLADPEGNAFCAFPRVDERPPGIFQIVVDSRDGHAQAAWWAALIGGEPRAEGPTGLLTDAPGLPWDDMVFDPVPEPKRVKNRLHWHVELLHIDPEGLIRAGATLLRRPKPRSSWWVLADPEGNEFCASGPASGPDARGIIRQR